MTEREAFLAAICAAPDEDLPRLVFADWLDEHGEPERAEFIRLQCELAHRWPCRELVRGNCFELMPPKDVRINGCAACRIRADHDIQSLSRERELLAFDNHLFNRHLDPYDRLLFSRSALTPLFTRGFLSGTMFPDRDPNAHDPPVYPAEEVAEGWGLACELFTRHRLVERLRCPGWFCIHVQQRTRCGEWRIDLWFDTPRPCDACESDGVDRFGHRCLLCGGNGAVEHMAFDCDSRDHAVSRVLPLDVGRTLLGDDHPFFQDDAAADDPATPTT